MNQYVTGQIIRKYRENKNITQQELADKLGVSGKTISKWETGAGFPDVSILEELSMALGVSMAELFSGDVRENRNSHSNMLLSGFYVCPICGNVISSVGDAFISCHGITLVREEASEGFADIERIEDELFITIDSPMSKRNYISFICGIYSDGIDFRKLYPEQEACARLKIRGLRKIYYYGIRNGLFFLNVPRR